MALKPDDKSPAQNEEERRKAREEEVLLREVDEAVRADTLSNFAQKYGKQLVALVVAGLAAFAFYLWWQSDREAKLDQASEELVKALDQVEAGNLGTADQSLASIAKSGNAGVAAVAKLVQAGIALTDGRKPDALKIYDEVAGDKDVEQPLRDLATLRYVSANFDDMDPQAVIDRLQPLAKPGNAYFPSAGELMAMAYLEQGKPKLAGPLFAEVSRDEQAPNSLRSRTRQMAGLLGVDAVDDIEEAIGSVAQEAPPPAQ